MSAPRDPLRKLAHVSLPGYGQPTWAEPRWVTPGPAQTITLLDAPTAEWPSHVTAYTPEGGVKEVGPPLTLPSATRKPRIAAFHASNPAVFQSYFRVHFESMFGATANLAQGARSLQPNKNPNARGKTDGQAIMTYDPWPSAGELYPKAL